MKVSRTEFEGLLLIDPATFADSRGFLMETWKESRFHATGIHKQMVQDNLSWSRANVLRGLHFQSPFAQEKLVYVLHGTIFDVAVDLRRTSATFAKWFGTRLSGDDKRQIYIPAGFAHGFCVLSDHALVAYKCTSEYCPDAEMSLAWNDPQIGIDWPVREPILSAKDKNAPLLVEIPQDRLPTFHDGEIASS